LKLFWINIEWREVVRRCFEYLLMRVTAGTFGRAGGVEAVAGGQGIRDLGGGVAGAAAGVGAGVLTGEESGGGEGEREE
jgi:hypothetical protein